MGIVYPAAESPLLKLLAPFLAKKKASSADGWGFDETPVKHVFGPLEDWFNQFAPSLEKKYPPTWKTKKHVLRQVRGLLLSEELAKEYGQYFDGLSYDELDAVARSWHFGEYHNGHPRLRNRQLCPAQEARRNHVRGRALHKAVVVEWIMQLQVFVRRYTMHANPSLLALLFASNCIMVRIRK